MSSLRNFRWVALAEATSFLLLLVASVIKNTGGSEVGVTILGPLHGALFIAYLVLAVNVKDDAGWTMKQTLFILAGAVLPFGGYVADWWVVKNERERVSPPPTRA